MIRPAFTIALMIPLAVTAAASAAATGRARHAAVRPHASARGNPAEAPERRPARSPLERVASANRSAVREPGRDDYLGATQVYGWSDGALYRLYTAPGEVSDVALEAGESLVSVAAGDTVRWVIGETASGTGASRRTHILVKPSDAGLRTNLVIATDRRVYHIEAESTAGTAMASISWTYPQDALLALHGAAGGPTASMPSVEVAALNFNYRIQGDKPPWRPLRAFDDGRQVFIEFPATLGEGEAPPLFARGESGQPELVNYRIRGRYYVVDGLFDTAELRLGGRHQQVVRIVRTARSS